MANPEHVEIVKQGATELQKWRDENPEKALDLSSADFFGAELSHSNLSKSDLSYANLAGANLNYCILRSANLNYAVLKSAYINSADLTTTNCSNADMSRSELVASNLRGTNLEHANLHRAYLNDSLIYIANLKHANLTRADLKCTRLIGSDLLNADLRNAITTETIWSNLDLSQVFGLELVNHQGPSSLDTRTLMKSQGKIPAVFLRGCGLSDDFISYIPSHFSSSAIDFYSCFISYSHEDKRFARRLHDALQGRGIRCWLDEHQILPGDNIYDRIDHGIRVWDKVLLCASKHSLTSGWVDDELKHAFAKEKQLFKDRGCEVLSLIPLNLDGYLFSDWNNPKKNQVRERMAPDFTGWETDNAKFDQQLERVVKALQTNNTGREPEPPSKL